MQDIVDLLLQKKLDEARDEILRQLSERTVVMVRDAKTSFTLEEIAEEDDQIACEECNDEGCEDCEGETVTDENGEVLCYPAEPVYEDEPEDPLADYGWEDIDEHASLNEAGAGRRIIIRVNFKGKRQRRVKCTPGYKLGPNKKSCVKIGGAERIRRKRAARKATRTKRKHGKGALKRAIRKRLRALKRRKAYGLKPKRHT